MVDEPGADALSGVELRQLRYFAAVAEAGTVTEAARRLHIAQPSLSQQIRLLARRIGTPLFRRLPHGMELTDAGRLLLGGVDKALSELSSSVSAARGTAAALAVGVCRGVPQAVLAAAEQASTLGRPQTHNSWPRSSPTAIRLSHSSAARPNTS